MSRQGLIQGKYRHEDGLWDDIRVPANVVVNVPGPLEPALLPFINDGGISEGTYGLWFDILHQSFFNIQLPHSWKVGTPIYPHVHWSTDAGGGPGDVVWLLEWVDAAVLTPFPPVTTTMTSSFDSVTGPYFHELVGFPTPIIPTGLSHILLGRIARAPSAAGSPPGGPDYPGLITLLEIDFHFQSDDIGSVSPFSKE
jgi:hypothetical protein